jgi:preprotein translocase subunit SecF
MKIIKNRKIYAFISTAIIIIGLVMFFVNGLNYGIDFSGGTLIQIDMGKFIGVDEVNEIMDEYDTNASVVYAGDNKEEIMIKSTQDFPNAQITEIQDKFVEKYDLDKENFQSQKVGPTMGDEIKNKALLSTLIATVLMLAYISWRFEFRFGISAIVALVHDILIMLSVYSIFRVPVNSAFIAAILTVVGYSINDTIVIFDRIREEMKLNPRDGIENTINNSIKKSLVRTINTSFTTFAAVLIIYLLGVEDIRVLAFPLMIGVISGTYSSLFVASPMLYELTNYKIKTAK